MTKQGSELFLVDNSDADWKVLRYLHDWCQIAKGLDIATGYFEIGSLLALKNEWQKVDHIRLLMGDEVSKRAKTAFENGLQKIRDRLDESIESEKQKNDFLTGVPAIVEAIRSGKIQCKVYRKEKFHAKAYITRARLEVVGSVALIVPKAARADVWERDLRRYLPHLSGRVFNDLWVLNHTDLLRVGEYQRDLATIKEKADAIVIDEAHHFRNPGLKGKPGEIQTRYWQLYDLLQESQGIKQLFMLHRHPGQ